MNIGDCGAASLGSPFAILTDERRPHPNVVAGRILSNETLGHESLLDETGKRMKRVRRIPSNGVPLFRRWVVAPNRRVLSAVPATLA